MQAHNKAGRLALSYPIDFGKTLNVAAFEFGHKAWPHDKWIVPAEHGNLAASFKGWGKPAQDPIKVPCPDPYNRFLLRSQLYFSSLMPLRFPSGASSTAPLPLFSTKAA